MSHLDNVLATLGALPKEERSRIEEEADRQLFGQRFIPSPGPQTEAWFSPADLLLYGGAGSGGKTGLLCGLALEKHTLSLLMRRNGTDLEGGGGIIEQLLGFAGTRDGFNGSSPATFRTGKKIITFGAVNNPGDENKFNGRARDFLGIDEATHFLEMQIRHLMGWVRTTVKGQRTRTVLASNPPMSSEGQWIIGMFRPWLDPLHPKPAKDGELRWYAMAPDGTEVEVDGPGPHEFPGGREPVFAKSRTFIRAAYGDNPYIEASYGRELDAMPEPLRSQLRDGNFMAARPDADMQVIPLHWVLEAQMRWTPAPPMEAPMSAIGVDIAQGGKDQTVLAPRYDGYYPKLEAIPGKDTPDGPSVAGIIIQRRKHGAAIIIDMGGGYGGSCRDTLKANGIEVVGFVPGGESVRSSVDGVWKFLNKRAEGWWRFREALDPSQEGGSRISLPPDPDLVAELTAPTYSVGERRLLRIESKEKIAARLGRSTDRADAVIMAWSSGPKVESHGRAWRGYTDAHRPGSAGGGKVVMGYADRRAKTRGR